MEAKTNDAVNAFEQADREHQAHLARLDAIRERNERDEVTRDDVAYLIETCRGGMWGRWLAKSMQSDRRVRGEIATLLGLNVIDVYAVPRWVELVSRLARRLTHTEAA